MGTQLGLDSGWLIQLDNPNAAGSRYRVLAIGNNENVLGLRQRAEQRCAKRCGKYVHCLLYTSIGSACRIASIAGKNPMEPIVSPALPMVLALLKMALVICIPLVLVIGTYDLKTVVTISIVQLDVYKRQVPPSCNGD